MRQRRLAAGAALALTTLLLGQPTTAAADPGDEVVPQPRTLRVASSDISVAMSANGQYVVFLRWLLQSPDDYYSPTSQVYRRDVHTGSTRLVSASPTGRPANAAVEPTSVAVSGDGRYVAYFSRSTNLTSQSTDGQHRLLVRDMDSTTTTAVPATASGVGADFRRDVSFSTGGRYLAYAHRARPEVEGATEVYRWGLGQPNPELVSQHYGSPTPGQTPQSVEPVISADGRFVAFNSDAPDLLSGHTLTGRHAYVRDVLLGTTRLVDRVPSGAPSGRARALTLSGNGRYVVLVSDEGLSAGEVPTRLVRRDLSTGRNEPIVPSRAGAPDWAVDARMSEDGRYVAYVGNPWPENGYSNQVYFRDMTGREVRRISARPDGSFIWKHPRNGDVETLAMSTDGRFVALAAADDLVPLRNGIRPGDPYEPKFYQVPYSTFRVGPLH